MNINFYGFKEILRLKVKWTGRLFQMVKRMEYAYEDLKKKKKKKERSSL